MKNLHKKIGAMFLAGMVVLGGVAAGGVNSFAASNKAAVKNIQQDAAYQKVEFFSRKYGEIIKVESKGNEIKKIIKKEYGNRKAFNMGRHVPVRMSSQIALKVYEAKCLKKEVISINYEDMYYLIKVK